MLLCCRNTAALTFFLTVIVLKTSRSGTLLLEAATLLEARCPRARRIMPSSLPARSLDTLALLTIDKGMPWPWRFGSASATLTTTSTQGKFNGPPVVGSDDAASFAVSPPPPYLAASPLEYWAGRNSKSTCVPSCVRGPFICPAAF